MSSLTRTNTHTLLPSAPLLLQVGARAVVHVWDAQTGSKLCVLGRKGVHRIGVTVVAFSLDGRRLLSIGQETAYSVAVWRTDR